MSQTTTTKQSKVQNLHDWQKVYKASNLNWEVEKRPLYNKEGKETPLFELIRSDTKEYLGNGTDAYHIIQNKRLFEFAAQLEKDVPGIKFDSANYLQNGKGVFVKCELPFQLDVSNVGDIQKAFLLLSTAHGGGSLQFALTILRLICTNGMTAFRSHTLTNVRHTSSAEDKIAMNQQVVKGISQDFTTFGQTLEILAKTQMSIPLVGKVIENVFDDGEDSNIHTSNVKQNKARSILNLFEINDGDTFKKQRNTAYALLNSFTRYADHNVNYRAVQGENEAQARLRGTMFGVGEALKMRALQEITKVVSETGVELPAITY